MNYPIIDMKATGLKTKELRIARHLKVHDIANFVGIESDQAVYKWQRCESLPMVDNLYALSKLFGVMMEDILVERKKKDEALSLIDFIETLMIRNHTCCVPYHYIISFY